MILQDYEKEHIDFLRKSLAECTVLLKKNGDFPLVAAGKIAAYGSGVRHTVKGGSGSGEVNSRYFVNVEQGLLNAGFEISTKEWLDVYDQVLVRAEKDFVKQVKRDAKAAHMNIITYGMGVVMPEPDYELPIKVECDTAIYVLSRLSGEGSDRKAEKGDIYLTETEKRDILELNRAYDKFMLVLNVGGPVDLSEVSEVKNILILSQLGVDTGSVLADILLGKANPSGKLATTWSDWEDYCSLGDFGNDEDTRYKEGIYVGYRWFDTVKKQARYPFGFGLSFTEFEQQVIEVKQNDTKNTVIAEVKNIGHFPGKQVVQLYVSKPEIELDQPYQVLAGWNKTDELQPGQSSRIEIAFDMKDIASYDTKRAAYVLENGDYVLRYGTSSVDTAICGIVKLTETIVVRQCDNCLGETDFEDFRSSRLEAKPHDIYAQSDTSPAGERNGRNRGLPADIDKQIIELSAKDFAVIQDEVAMCTSSNAEIEPLVEVLTDSELIYMNIGAFAAGGAIASVIGNAAFSVAGAAGQTTLRCKEKKIGSLVMADGPAGVRVAKDYYKDKKGVHALGAVLPESVTRFLSGALKTIIESFAKKPEKVKGEILHNYATALPIGTAIAQSFNSAFAEQCGKIVGDEMSRIGVNLWLAPALNIHRNIRCGRNFEYFSEDPLVSGKIAAALTKGVQSYPGCGVTLKHFAANNQETNRYNSNSIVSERAMREIYLKGFELCIKEAKPVAVMTSYNLLNGGHTSESKSLNTHILREEFGFDGMIMTDWVVASGMLGKKNRHKPPQAYKVALSGNDVFMPGSSKEYKNIAKALKSGKIDRQTLMVNASRVYRVIKRLEKKCE